MNKAYMKHHFPKYTVLTGINFYPFKIDVKMYIGKISSLAASFIVPFGLSLGLPVFMYSIVLEKEKKLVDTMKINGLLLSNYWVVMYTFYFLYYGIIATTFYVFGRFVLGMHVFVATHSGFFIIVLIGWGFSQVSLAFFLSVFFKKATTASLVGYLFGILLMGIACIANAVVYACPRPMPWFHFISPTHVFNRNMEWIADECVHHICFTNFGMHIPGEFVFCMILPFFHAVFYLALAWYCAQVVPQSHGVPKKWNFLCKKNKGQKIETDLDEGRE